MQNNQEFIFKNMCTPLCSRTSFLAHYSNLQYFHSRYCCIQMKTQKTHVSHTEI